VARDWEDCESVLSDMRKRMDRFGKNVAPVPLCITEEYDRDTDVTQWVVDLHIKVVGVTEFDLQGYGSTRSAAIRRAYLGLNREESLITDAAKSNLLFGVAV
jgi:hypothetical protein